MRIATRIALISVVLPLLGVFSAALAQTIIQGGGTVIPGNINISDLNGRRFSVVAGSNITVTTSSTGLSPNASNTITISSTGGGGSGSLSASSTNQGIIFFGLATSTATSSLNFTIVTSTGDSFLNVIGVASSSQISSASGTIVTFSSTNVSSTNLQSSGYFRAPINCSAGDFFRQSAGANMVCGTPASGGGTILGDDGQILQKALGNNATSSIFLTMASSTGLFTVSATSSFTGVGSTTANWTFTGANTQITNQFTFTNSSGTNLNVSGYGTFPTLRFTNASGTTANLTGSLQVAGSLVDFNGNKYSTSTGGGGGTTGVTTSTPILENAVAFFTSSNASSVITTLAGLTVNSSTGQLVSGSSSLTSVSSTNITASGYISGGTLLQGSTGVVLTTRQVNTTSPLGGGGALSANLTLTCTTCLVTQALPSSTSWVDSQFLFGQLAGTATTSALFTISTSTGALSAASTSWTSVSSTNITASGYIAVGSNLVVLANRNINTTGPITGGGNLSADRTIACATCLVVQSLPSSTSWVDTQVLFGALGGGSTSSVQFTFATSTAILTVNASSSIFLGGGVGIGTSTVGSGRLTYFGTSAQRPQFDLIPASTSGPSGGVVAEISLFRGRDFTTNFSMMDELAYATSNPAFRFTNHYGGTGVSGSIAFGYFQGTGTNYTDVLVITTSTYVGINALYPSSTLHVVGLTNQTDNLFNIASSTGQLFFAVSPMGVASSTEFRSASGTFAQVYDTNLTSGNCVQAAAGGQLTTTGSACGSGGGLTTGVDGQVLQGMLGGSASSTFLIQFSTSTQTIGFGLVASTTALSFMRSLSVGTTTLLLQGVANQTANFITISSSTGGDSPLFSINAIGQILMGATSTVPASSTILQVATSSPIFTILNTGAVGVGSSTPTAFGLTVANPNQPKIYMTIDTSVLNPSILLNVQTSSTVPIFQVFSSSTTSFASSSAQVLGGGTVEKVAIDAATSIKIPALAQNATTTISFNFTGASAQLTTSTPMHCTWGGFATSTDFIQTIGIVSVLPSSTPNGLDVTIIKLGSGTTVATGLVTSTVRCIGF